MLSAAFALRRGAGRGVMSVARRAMRLRGCWGRGGFGARRATFRATLFFEVFRTALRLRERMPPPFSLPVLLCRRFAILNPYAAFLFTNYSKRKIPASRAYTLSVIPAKAGTQSRGNRRYCTILRG